MIKSRRECNGASSILSVLYSPASAARVIKVRVRAVVPSALVVPENQFLMPVPFVA